MSKNITLEILLARKTQSENNKMKVRLFHSEILDGNLEVEKLSLYRVLNKLEEINEEKTATENFFNTCLVILDHVPLLRNKELQKEYDCIEPTDIVVKVFDNNMGEINKLTNFIFSLYGLDNKDKEKEKKDLKNDIKN